jgi:hypothetical protein
MVLPKKILCAYLGSCLSCMSSLPVYPSNTSHEVPCSIICFLTCDNVLSALCSVYFPSQGHEKGFVPTKETASWSRVVFENLIVKKFIAFYEIQKFIPAFTRAHQWALSWITWIQPSQYMYVPSVLILYPHFRWGLPSGIFFSVFPSQRELTLPHVLHHRPYRPPYFIILTTLGE